MKVMGAILGIIALGWVTVYYLGGYASFDPNEQGEQARRAITIGMPCATLWDTIGEPGKYHQIYRRVRRIGGEEIEYFEAGPAVKFNRDRVLQRLAGNDLRHGFTTTYHYSNRTAFTVHFDGSGNVTGVEDAATMADLLQVQDD